MADFFVRPQFKVLSLYSLFPPCKSPPSRSIQQLRYVATAMEVEVKLRLPDSISHQKLSTALSPYHTKTLLQENIFFDTTDSKLAKNLAALRLRFYNLDSHCALSLKAKPILANGISRVEEQEEPMDSLLGRLCVSDPKRLASLEGSAIMEKIRKEFGVREDDGLVCLGGFKNVRQVFEWRELTLEVDETVYDFGTSYEVECESKEPERVKELIEQFLKDNGIKFSYSNVNKFTVFRSGKLQP